MEYGIYCVLNWGMFWLQGVGGDGAQQGAVRAVSFVPVVGCFNPLPFLANPLHVSDFGWIAWILAVYIQWIYFSNPLESFEKNDAVCVSLGVLFRYAHQRTDAQSDILENSRIVCTTFDR